MGNDNIMVSVWCQTYNHKEYIKDALEGFVSQQTNFAYQVIVFDDASTDGTSDIVREYAAKYPKIFHIIIAEENTFSNPEKWKWPLQIQPKYLTGKYVSFCEGDDYWIDPHKLQIQVDYMESHPECSLYLHNGLWIDCRDLSMETMNPYDDDAEQEVSAEKLIMQYKKNPPTASMLCRRELIETPSFMNELLTRDYVLQLYALTKGSVHYNSRIMSVYRFRRKGSYTETTAADREFMFNHCLGILCFLPQYDEYTNYKYHVWITNRIQLYASWFVYDIDSNIVLTQYFYMCKKYKRFYPLNSDACIEKLENLRRQTFDLSYCSNLVREFVKKHKQIVLMGTGKYSTIIIQQFENNGINFCGFAVSKKKKGEDNFMGKPVWMLSQIPFIGDDMGVIVAINPEHWDDILGSLETAGIENYCCPFLLEPEYIEKKEVCRISGRAKY